MSRRPQSRISGRKLHKQVNILRNRIGNFITEVSWNNYVACFHKFTNGFQTFKLIIRLYKRIIVIIQLRLLYRVIKLYNNDKICLLNGLRFYFILI